MGLAPALLAVSVIIRLASTMISYFVTGDFFFDLHVYVVGGAALNHPGTLYDVFYVCLLYTSPSPRDGLLSRMPSSA